MLLNINKINIVTPCFFLFFIITFFCSYAPFAHSSEVSRVSIQLKRIADFRFAGYYIAKKKGFYEDAGLDVTILPSNNDIPISSTSTEEDADFFIGDSSLLVDYNAGRPVVALGALFQTSSLAAISLFDKRIGSPSNFAYNTILINDKISEWTIKALAKKSGVSFESINRISGLHKIPNLLSGKTDVILGCQISTPYILDLAGSNYRIIDPKDYGLEFYDDILYTKKQFLVNNPETVKKFLEATWKGWDYAFANVDETISIIHSPRISVDHLRYEASSMRKFVLPDLIDIGTMTRSRWEKIASSFVDVGALNTDYSLDGFLYNPKQYESINYYYIILWATITITALTILIFILLTFIKSLKISINEKSSHLRENQERLLIALKNSKEGLWDWDIEENSFYYTPGCFTVLGYTPDEIPYSLDIWKSFLHPEDSEPLNTSLTEAINNPKLNKSTSICVRIRSKTKEYIFISLTFTTQELTTSGTAKRIIVTQKDITQEKETEKILQSRLTELTRPLIDTENLTFSNIFDVKKIQYIQDSFAKMTKVAAIIVSTDGIGITEPSNFSPFCNLIRSTTIGCTNCIRSDSDIETERGSYLEKVCGSAGLMDGGTSIWVGEKRIAHWLIGQVRYSDKMSEQQKSYARKIGIDEDEYREAFEKLPIMSHEHFEDICKTMAIIAEQLSEMAYQNVSQARVINEKQQTEKRLKSSEEKLVEAQRLASIGSWRLNTETNMFSGSKQFWEKLQEQNPPEEEVDISISFSNFAHDCAEDTQIQIKNLLDSATRESTVEADIAYRLKSTPEKQRYAHIIARVTEQTKNGYDIIEGTSQDITERALSEIALRESQENLRIIFESIVNGLIVTDEKGLVTQANPVALEILNMISAELINSDIQQKIELLEPETMLPITNPITKVLEAQEKIIHNEHCTYIANGEIQKHLTVNASPIKNASGRLIGAVLVLHDISEQHELEQRLRQSQKLEAIGKLAGGIAHDFNNLLGGIMGFADLICITTKEEKAKEFASKIIDTSERAAELTTQMLAFARKGNASSQPTNVHKCIENAIAILNHSIGKKVLIKTQLDAKQYTVIGDATQLQNGILNLGINARDSIENYGEFTIETGNTILDQEYCNSSEFDIKPGEYLYIIATDTGCGIPPSIINKVFEPFFTTKGVGKGTGLGLSALLGTIITHNGSIQITSQENKGTRFDIYLPLISSSCNEESPLASTEKKHTCKTILLVDDQSIAISLGKSILHENGYKVLTAYSGEQALKVYLEKGHNIDLVIMDIVMPIMGGEETTEHLLEIDPKAKIVLSSGIEKSEQIDELIVSGKIAGFTHKPYTSKKLLQIIKDIF